MDVPRTHYTPAEMRELISKQKLPQVGLLQSVISNPPATLKHVDANTALCVSIEVLGLQAVLYLLKAEPTVLQCWMALVEDLGWGRVDAPRNLTATLLVNGIKTLVRARGITSLEGEGLIHQTLQDMQVSPDLSMLVIDRLIFHKEIEYPWASWIL